MKPIIFNSEDVRAILAGRKTQTRRVMKPHPEPSTSHPCCKPSYKPLGDGWHSVIWTTPKSGGGIYHDRDENSPWKCPFGRPGDRLYVRETLENDGDGDWWYAADTEYLIVNCPEGWLSKQSHKPIIPSIHMPKWAARIFLEITDVRVERLQDISEQDAKAEGIGDNYIKGYEWNYIPEYDTKVKGFSVLWDSIYGTWDANPWVWVIEFKRVEA